MLANIPHSLTRHGSTGYNGKPETVITLSPEKALT